MSVWFKQGVTGELKPVAQKGLGRLGKLYEMHHQDLFVTSIRDGLHHPGSFHYIGLALDFRGNEKVTELEIKTTLGSDWDVVPYMDSRGNIGHVHAEYDPK